FLDEALATLLENAFRHTPPGTPIRLSSGAAADGFVRLTVEDGGGGVPADTLPHLFEKFFQAVPERRGRGTPARQSRAGTGIGLAVVRGLSEAMGGRAEARHSTLGGLAVDLDLPAAPLPAELTGTA